ncbi:MAG: cupin domain-containing protein [Candidatus Scalindua sp.]|nr:cupin domain-containing protein [Candidatus Scalindua sp.]MCR4344945.1 cupin domain-containing protein [Candidatus Scalindua sp.]
MQKNSLSKDIILLIISVSVLVINGCLATKKSGEFVESLRNPTSFPEIFLPEIKYIDDIVDGKSLADDENVMIIPLGQDKSTSVYLFQMKPGAEMDSHYHNTHDEILYIKQGSGLIELNDTRYIVKEGMVVMIPRQSGHKYVNTGEEISITVSMFSPPFDGKDIKVLKTSTNFTRKKKTVYDKLMKKSVKELKKEKGEGEERKWFGLRKKDEEGSDSGEGEEDSYIPEEQKILVLTDEGREKIREARKKVNAEEKTIIDKIVLDEKLMTLQRLQLDGLISDEEFEKKKAEIIEESGLSD